MTEFITARGDIGFREKAILLTMHLLNATRHEPQGAAAMLFRRVQHVATAVETGLVIELDRSSLAFAKHSYPASCAIVEKANAYVAAATGSELTGEEMFSVVVHVERSASHFRSGDDPASVQDERDQISPWRRKACARPASRSVVVTRPPGP